MEAEPWKVRTVFPGSEIGVGWAVLAEEGTLWKRLGGDCDLGHRL